MRLIKTLLPFLLLVLQNTTVISQNVSGKIINKSNDPVPYATIQIGDDYGVISNEEGNFTINTESFKPSDSVYISSLGFEKSSYLLKEFTSKDYILQDQINELSEVFLTNRQLSVDSILFYVNKNIEKNYKSDMIDYEVFSRKTDYIKGKDVNFEIDKSTGFKKRQLEAFNKDFNELETSLLNNKSKQYTDFVGHLKVKDENASKLTVLKAVRLLDEKNDQSLESLAEKGKNIVSKHLDKDKVYTVKSGLFKISDSVSLDNDGGKMADTINSVGLLKNLTFDLVKAHGFKANSIFDFITDTKKYEYVLKDVTFLNSELVYVITFKPKRGSVNYEGTFYVSNETFAVLKADYKFYKGRIGEKFNLRLLLGIKYVEKNQKGSVIYKQADDGYYYPSYITQQIDRYFYISRPFKFIENDNSKNKVAFDFKVEGTFKEKKELLILSHNALMGSDYDNTTEKKDIEYQTSKRYDPAIWEGYNVLEPLEEMKNFKVDDTTE